MLKSNKTSSTHLSV